MFGEVGARLCRRIAIQEGCWRWLGLAHRVRVGGRSRRVHRVLYEVFVGPVPKGQELTRRASCPNPDWCVAPSCFEVVTKWQNLMRYPNTLAARHSAVSSCPKGHPYDEVNTIYSRRGRGVRRSCRACAKDRRRLLAASSATGGPID